MKCLYLLIMLIVFAFTSHAQTFQVTDITFNERMPEHRIQRIKNQQLGQMCQITVFDNDIKIQLLDKNGKPEGKPIVMQLQLDGTYKSSRTDSSNPSYPYVYTNVMTVEKIMGYYRSLKIDRWENQDYLWTLILKRK